jgi:hypothetical protein
MKEKALVRIVALFMLVFVMLIPVIAEAFVPTMVKPGKSEIVSLRVMCRSSSSQFQLDIPVDTLFTRRKTKYQSPGASDKPRPAWKSRLSFGGNLSFQPGSPLVIDLSPTVGYRIPARQVAANPLLPVKEKPARWVVGVGANYQYIRRRPPQKNAGNAVATSYGGRGFAQYGLFKFLALRAEYEVLNMTDSLSGAETKRRWISNPLVGAGLMVPFGNKKSAMSLMVLYNLNYSNQPLNRTLYPSPWVFRTGVSF